MIPCPYYDFCCMSQLNLRRNGPTDERPRKEVLFASICRSGQCYESRISGDVSLSWFGCLSFLVPWVGLTHVSKECHVIFSFNLALFLQSPCSSCKRRCVSALPSPRHIIAAGTIDSEKVSASAVYQSASMRYAKCTQGYGSKLINPPSNPCPRHSKWTVRRYGRCVRTTPNLHPIFYRHLHAVISTLFLANLIFQTEACAAWGGGLKTASQAHFKYLGRKHLLHTEKLMADLPQLESIRAACFIHGFSKRQFARRPRRNPPLRFTVATLREFFLHINHYGLICVRFMRHLNC